jgi:hypothetical protein
MVVRLTERADILLDGVILPTGQQWTAQSAVVLVFKNFGRTRADNVVFQFRVFIPEIPETQGVAKGLTPIVLAPTDTQTVPFQPFNAWMTEEWLTKVASGHLSLRYDGEVTYNDVFAKRHTTKCSGTFMPESRTFRVDDQFAD